MKMQLHMILKGNENLKKKFEETISANPNLHLNLIQAFGQTLMMAFRLSGDDGIVIESFRLGEIAETIEENLPVEDHCVSKDSNIENKVEN